jgi:TetR/AcrR family transcriptional regulator, upper aerobic nicotinate degradation pathway regulator
MSETMDVTKTSAKPRQRNRKPTSTTRDPIKTRKAILDAAIEEFSREGFAGGRVDRISAAAGSNERMLYYYFGNKEGIWLAALETIYENHVEAERALLLNTDDPVAALETLVEFHWEYYRKHPEFISLLGTENMLQGRNLARSSRLSNYSSPMLNIIQGVLSQGVKKGQFRGDVTAEHLFLTICSMTYFYLANLHTLSNYLNRDLSRPSTMETWLHQAKRVVVNSILDTPSN